MGLVDSSRDVLPGREPVRQLGHDADVSAAPRAGQDGGHRSYQSRDQRADVGRWRRLQPESGQQFAAVGVDGVAVLSQDGVQHALPGTEMVSECRGVALTGGPDDVAHGRLPDADLGELLFSLGQQPGPGLASVAGHGTSGVSFRT